MITLDAIEVLLTSVSMSVDAMTVNATNGLTEKGISQKKMLFISFLFGLFQFMMPTIGYFIGQTFEKYVAPWVPWIGSGLLLLLAIKSFIDWFKEFKEAREAKRSGEEPVIENKKITVGQMFVQAVATSIDALCIGFAYMALNIPSAMIFFGVIGVTTFVLSYLTVLLAKQLAKILQSWAGLAAAIVFLGLAIKILLTGILG